MPATQVSEILTLTIPPEGLSASQYRLIEQELKEWEQQVRENARAYPLRSYELGTEQTLAFLKLVGALGQASLPPAGVAGPTKDLAVEWLDRYTLHEIDGALARYIDEIRSAVLYGLRGSSNPTQVASWLYKATRDAKVNWRTIARTEMVRANAAGRLDSIARMGYDQVWAPRHTGACSACRRLLEGRAFPLEQVRDATNFGRPVKDWIACIPLHPHCRHVWLPYIEDVFNEAQAEYDALADNGLDDKTLNEMFDSGGHLKPQYENDPRILAFFEQTGKTLDPLEFALGRAVAKTRREEPPALHHTSDRARRCETCMSHNGVKCDRYQWRVDDDEVCDSWELSDDDTVTDRVSKGYFDNPQLGLDPLLWTRQDRLRADVRDRIVAWWRHVFTEDAPLWSSVYITGSAAARAWAGRRSAGDVDLQLVVDYAALREHHPEYLTLSDPELHAALVTQVKASLEGVEAAPGLPLDAFIRPETSRGQFAGDVAEKGQGVYDLGRGRWLVRPPEQPTVEDYEGGEILEGEGGTVAVRHPEWLAQARALREAMVAELEAVDAIDHGDREIPAALDELRAAYRFVHDLREREFHTGRGADGLGNFIWRYLMDFGPLARIKHLLTDTPMEKCWPLYRWSDGDQVAKGAGQTATDAGVEHWITVHPHGPGTEGQPVLVRNSQDGKHMVVIGGAGGHLNYLRIDRTRRIKSDAKTGPLNEPADDSFEQKTPEQLDQEEREATARMDAAREHLGKIQQRRQEVNGQLQDYISGIVNSVGQTTGGERLGWDDLTPEEQKQLFSRMRASAIHVAVEGPLNQKDVNESGLTIKREEPDGPDAPEKGTLDSALADEQADELAETPDGETPEEQTAKRKMPLIALATDQADAINRLVEEQRILAKQATKARKIAGGEKRNTDAMALDYTADDVSNAVKNRIGSEQRQRVARSILETAESNTSKKLMDRAVKQGGYDTLDTFAQAVLGNSQIKPEVARLLGVSGTAQLVAHKLYTEARAGRLDIDKAYDALDELTSERETDVAARARARALKATEEVKTAMEAAKQSGQTNDLAGLCTRTAANSMRQRKLIEAAASLGMAISGLEAASAIKVAMQRVVGPRGVKDGKIRLASGGVDQIRVAGFSGKYQIGQLAKQAGIDLKPSQLRRLGSGNYEVSLDPRSLEHLFQGRQDTRDAVRDSLEKIRTASDLDTTVQAQRQTPGMSDVLSPAQAKGKMFLLAAEDPLLGFAPGVGKTHTALAAAMQLMHDEPDKKHRALIIAPKAVAKEWRDTVEAQGGTHTVQVLGSQYDSGDGEDRSKDQERGANWKKQLETPADFNVVSYETLRAHPEIAEQLGATIQIADEIQKAKNENSDIARGLRSSASGLAHHWSLTGTAIEKHTGDIHSMLSWGGAEGLGDQKTFREKWDKAGQYDHVTGEERIRQFRDGISDRAFFLSSQDAGNDLPPRNAGNGGQMHEVHVQLSEAHRELLRQKVQEVNETNADLRARRKAGERDSKGRLIRGSLPFGGRDAIMRNLHKPEGIAVEDHAIAQKVAQIAEENPGFEYDGAKTGGQHAGHYDGKTVVFAEQVGHLAIVKKALEQRGIRVFEGHSSASMETGKQLSNADNSNNIRDFLAHPGKAVFLSSDKNNAGVNLQLGVAKGRFQHGATRLVHLTLPANNARIDQREARIHRKGSVAPADTYSVTADTPFEKLDRDRLTQERRRMDLVGNREDEVRTPGGKKVRTIRQRYTEQGGRIASEQEAKDAEPATA